MNATGGERLDGEKNDRMAFQARADLQNLVIGWLRKECRSLGGGTVVRFPWFWMSSGESRLDVVWEDYLAFDIQGQPLIVVRDRDGELGAVRGIFPRRLGFCAR